MKSPSPTAIAFASKQARSPTLCRPVPKPLSDKRAQVCASTARYRARSFAVPSEESCHSIVRQPFRLSTLSRSPGGVTTALGAMAHGVSFQAHQLMLPSGYISRTIRRKGLRPSFIILLCLIGMTFCLPKAAGPAIGLTQIEQIQGGNVSAPFD